MPVQQFGASFLVMALLQFGAHTAAFAATTVERGRLFVEKNCARCHAIGPTGSSPYAPAPPFRTLHERYDVGDLTEGIVVAHQGGPQMPQFMLQLDQIDDLIAYLRSVQPKTATR